MLMSRKGRLTGEEFTVNLIEGWKELIWRIKSLSSCLVHVQSRKMSSRNRLQNSHHGLLQPSHEEVGQRRCHGRAHSCSKHLLEQLPVKFKHIALQGPYAPQGSTPLLPKLSVTSKVSAPTSHTWVGSRVHFRSTEDVTLLEFTSPVDRD